MEANHSFNTFILFIIHKTSNIHHVHGSLSIKYIAEIKHTRILILKKRCPAISYVVAIFHPTIGQCAHQSFSSTATLELGMIPTRNKRTTCLHTQQDHTSTVKPTHSWVSQTAKATSQ